MRIYDVYAITLINATTTRRSEKPVGEIVLEYGEHRRSKAVRDRAHKELKLKANQYAYVVPKRKES
jgi:hypothetical protein